MTSRISKKSNLKLCTNCGQYGVVTRYRNKLFGEGLNAVVIEGVPILLCEVCGESFYDPDVWRLIEEILANPEQYSVKREINVASFSSALSKQSGR
jgi:YgiT-type zinc finger domain-containing protein